MDIRVTVSELSVSIKRQSLFCTAEEDFATVERYVHDSESLDILQSYDDTIYLCSKRVLLLQRH